jgi:hypothetical protein
LRYAISRGALGLAYVQDISAGGGLFLGAQTDEVRLDLTRQFSHTWTGTLRGAYAYNRRLLSTAGATADSYNTWEVGPALSRTVGRYARVSFTYDLAQQHSLAAGITSFSVGQRQTFGIKFTFSFRPIELQ